MALPTGYSDVPRRAIRERPNPRATRDLVREVPEELAWMGRAEKTLAKLLRGRSDANMSFREICRLLRTLGFIERVRGSHHIFAREGVAEILNLQPRGDGKAKPYQMKQVRTVIRKYELGGFEDEA